MDIKVGRTYRAKRPSCTNGLVNDRTVLHIEPFLGIVTYDGPSVNFGRHYPKVAIATFEKWAARDVTDELPDKEYQVWDWKDRSKNK